MKTMSIDCKQYFVAKDGQVTGERSVSSICQLCVRGNPHPLYACGTPPCIGSPLPMHWVLDLGLRKNPQPLCACCVKSPGIGSPLGHRCWVGWALDLGLRGDPHHGELVWYLLDWFSGLGLALSPWSWPTLSATCDIRLLWIRIGLSTLSWSCH